MNADLRDSLAQVLSLLEVLLYRADLVSDQVATAAAEGGMHPDYPAIERLCERTTAYQEAYAAFEPYKAEFFAMLRTHGPALLAMMDDHSPDAGKMGEEWRTIESAPSEGVIELAVASKTGADQRTMVAERSFRDGEPYWMVTHGWVGWTTLHPGWTPYAWRPLPAAPTEGN